MHESITKPFRDTMLVCRNGHVLTDLLHSESSTGAGNCPRCGAAALSHCLTCGQPIAGGALVPGLTLLGRGTPPDYCSGCGAPFPWKTLDDSCRPDPIRKLERLLRRLPRVARQIRNRQGNKPPFRIEEQQDLEDLTAALLSLDFDDVRPESRTPSYSFITRTDFLLARERIALTCKHVRAGVGDADLGQEFPQDIVYWQKTGACSRWMGFVYDPEALLREPAAIERAWGSEKDDFSTSCLIARP
jgi:hypothetical protein